MRIVLSDFPQVLDRDDLARALRRSPRSIPADMVRNPQSLPPWTKFPGTRKPVWIRTVVEQWLEERSQVAMQQLNIKKR